jgi:hypothetical protein
VKVNAWIEIRNDFDWPAENPEDDTELQAKNRETLSRCGDVDVQPDLYEQPSQGPRSWQLYSLTYEVNSDQEFEQAIERFKSENPGTTDVLGAWYWEGNMVQTTLVITEEPNPEYVGEPFEIPNPDYQPDPELPDYDPRVTIRNPLWVPEFITVYSQSGPPLYPVPGKLSNFMPDGDATLRDVNLYYGQRPRIFS